MAAIRHSVAASTVRSGTRQPRWYPLQAGLLGAGLVALAVVMYLSAASGGAALRSSPPSSATDEAGAVAQPRPSSSAGSPAAVRHLVLLVSDVELGLTVRRRILAGEIIRGEFGAYASPLTIEVLVAGSSESLHALTEGLREFEARCTAEPCPAIQVLDLRMPLPE